MGDGLGWESGIDRLDPERLWISAVLTVIAVLIGGSLLFPRQVYGSFIWRYFWGPVVADGTGSQCTRYRDGETILIESAADCQTATGIVAEPGYTTVSTVSYAIVLLFAIVGVIFLLRRLDIGQTRDFFFALVPFMLFGGALRVVEDANVAFMREASPFIPFPWSAFFISPFIYFTVFLITLGAVLGSVVVVRHRPHERFESTLGGIGMLLLLITVGSLSWLAVSTTVLGFYWIIPVLTLGGATGIALIVWLLTERYAPEINEGTGRIGPIVVWGHTVDGIANVLMLDWALAIGLPGGYTPKHVVNAAIARYTALVQPEWVSDLVGTAWPFLPVKVVAAVAVVWLFDEQIFDVSPRYAVLLLVTILAVGLGPGSRDFLRATFGI